MCIDLYEASLLIYPQIVRRNPPRIDIFVRNIFAGSRIPIIFVNGEVFARFRFKNVFSVGFFLIIDIRAVTFEFACGGVRSSYIPLDKFGVLGEIIFVEVYGNGIVKFRIVRTSSLDILELSYLIRSVIFLDTLQSGDSLSETGVHSDIADKTFHAENVLQGFVTGSDFQLFRLHNDVAVFYKGEKYARYA